MNIQTCSRRPIDRECQGTHPCLIFATAPLRSYPIEGLDELIQAQEVAAPPCPTTPEE